MICFAPWALARNSAPAAVRVLLVASLFMLLGCRSSKRGAKAPGFDDDDAPMCSEDPRRPLAAKDFEPGMTPPRLTHFRQPPIAEENDPRIDGQEPRTIFKCVITVEGRAEQCCILEETSHAVTRSYLWVMPEWRYQPAKEKGQPVAVDYVVRIGITTHPVVGKTVSE